jgi:hypothetical protein
MKLTFNDKQGKFTSYEKPLHVRQQLGNEEGEGYAIILQFKDNSKIIPCVKENCDIIYDKIIETIDDNTKRYFILPYISDETNYIARIITKVPDKVSMKKYKDSVTKEDHWSLEIDDNTFDFATEKEFKLVWTDLLRFIENLN